MTTLNDDPPGLADVRRAILSNDLADQTLEDLIKIEWRLKWVAQARAKQIPPSDEDWFVYLLLSGRGFGKTVAAMNWLAWEAIGDPNSFNAVIAPTHNDLRGTNFEGPVGLLRILPPELVEDYNRNNAEIKLINGAMIRGFSATEPDRLRGPQFHRAAIDELAAWERARMQETWDNLMFGLRLGNRPRVFIATTPRPIELLRDLVAAPTTKIVSGTTYENRANLAPSFFNEISKYEGTRIGRQEIHGEILDLEDTGVIKRSWFKLWPTDERGGLIDCPPLSLVIMSLDTAFTEKTVEHKTFESDYSACTIWGVFQNTKLKSQNGIPLKPRNEVILLDAWQDRLGLPDLVDKLRKDLGISYGPADIPIIQTYLGPRKAHATQPNKKIDAILIEHKGSGISLRQHLMREGVPTWQYNPGKADKLTRLHIVSCWPLEGRVWIPESERFRGKPKTWAEPLLEQVCSYHGERSIKHDDLMDSFSQALRVFADRGIFGQGKPDARKPGPDLDPHDRRDKPQTNVLTFPRKNPYAA